MYRHTYGYLSCQGVPVSVSIAVVFIKNIF